MDKDKQPNFEEAALTVEELARQVMREAALGSASLDGKVLPQPSLDESEPDPPA